MTTYALVRPDGTIERLATDIDPNAGTKPGFKWLPLVKEPPVFDPATQVAEGPFYEALPDFVREYYTIRAKTPEELSREIDAKIERIGEETRRVLERLDERVTALEGKQSGGGFLGFLRSIFGG